MSQVHYFETTLGFTAFKMSINFSIVASRAGLIITSSLKEKGEKKLIQNISHVIQIWAGGEGRSSAFQLWVTVKTSHMGTSDDEEKRGGGGTGGQVYCRLGEGCVHSRSGAGRSFMCSFSSKLGRERAGRELTVRMHLVGVNQSFGYFTYSIPSITTLKKSSVRIIIIVYMDWNRLREFNMVKKDIFSEWQNWSSKLKYVTDCKAY